MNRLFAVALTAGLFVLPACGSDDEPTAASSTTSSSTSVTSAPSTSTTTSTAPVAGEEQVRVYFAWNEALGTAGRSIEAADPEAAAREAVEALLAGPDGFETDIGMGSEIPDGTVLLDLSIDDGSAAVDLSPEFQSGGGSLSMSLRVAQLVFTLTQFDAVREVDISLGGEPVEAIGGEGVPATDLDRTDFTGNTPFILVESPVPGDEVASGVEVSGIANTFEGTVNYVVTDPDGLIVDEGFTTATAGNGTWGSFSFVTQFETERSGLGAVIVFELSAEDGSQQNVYEVPVRMSA